MTTDNRGNKGIHISGNGKFMAETVAVGDNARAGNTIHQLGGQAEALAQLREQIEWLVKLVEQNGAHVQPGVQVASQELKAEADKAQPEKSKVLPLLEKISTGTKSVSTIATSVAAIVKLAAAVFV